MAMPLDENGLESMWADRGFTMALISIATACVCNYASTFQQEVKYVWGSWNFGSIVFFLVRYLSLVSLLIGASEIFSCVAENGAAADCDPDDNRRTLTAVAYFTGIAVLMTSMVLLQVRTHALLGKSMIVFVTFTVLDVLGLVIFITLQLFLAGGTNMDVFIWIPFTFIEFVTFLFTLKKTFAVYRLAHGARWNIPPLVAQLIHDNILYFVIILVLYGLGIILTFLSAKSIVVQFAVAVAASGVIATNLFLQLKQVNDRDNEEVMDLYTMSDIRYDSLMSSPVRPGSGHIETF